MNPEPGRPSEIPPPRDVEPWTHVPGHEVDALAGRRGFCSCGAGQTDDAEPSDEWRHDHLRDAWPVLVPRLPGEAVEQWMNRTSQEHVAASQTELDLFEQLGDSMGLREGEPIPVMSPDYIAAGNRVQVLEHQLAELLERSVQRLGLTEE